MLKNKEKLRKIRNIIIALIAIITLLSFYIKIRYERTKEINTIGTDEFGNAKSTTIAAIDLEHGTIIPEYKPKWEKQGSTLDLANQILTVTVKGSAYKTQTINPDVSINYASDVTSALTAEDITVYIDDVEVTDETNPKVVVNTGVESTNPTSSKKEITHTIILSNLERATREAGKLYKDWSGNVSIKIAGRGESTDTYDENVLKDEYGNQNMMESDEGQADGTWLDIKFGDAQTTTNQDGVMFIDYIEPEFTYESAETIIGDGNHGDTKILTVVFYAADKYFDATNSTGLALSDLTFKVDGETVDINVSGNSLNSENLPDGKGIKYTLVVRNLEKTTGEPYRDYSGPVSIVLPANKFQDFSGNKNNEKTITVGVDEPINSYTAPYLPTGYSVVEGTNLETGLVIKDGSGNEFVWVEVPKSDALYLTAGTDLNLDSLTGTALTTAYTNIENDLQEYTRGYRNGTTYRDEHSGNDATTSLTSSEYTTLKQKMLKSIYQNGGFYVGRYETGTTTARTSSSDTLTTPVIKQNMYPYNYVTNAQAQELSERFATTGYSTSLLFGVQWDLVLKHLETKGAATVAALKEDSTLIGNHSGTLLSTGTEDAFSKMGIFDLAGNVKELTLEFSKISGSPTVIRSDCYDAASTASYRAADSLGITRQDIGFRTALYKVTQAEDYELINQPEIVDVVDPVWETENINIDHTNKKVTVDLVATDKYYKDNSLSIGEDINSNGILDEGEDINGNEVLDANNIDIYIDGVKITTTDNVKKSLSAPTALTEQRIVDGSWQDVTYGVKYTLTITDWEEATRQSGKNYKEWSGTTTIEIAANTIEDQYGNKSNLQNFTLGHVDFIKPEIELISSTSDNTAKTETIVFTATDKYFDLTDSTNTIEKSDILIYVDEEDATADLINDATLTKTSIDGGYRYTLVISNFEKNRNAKNYENWSGTVAIQIKAGVVKDTNTPTPNVNDITPLLKCDFVDFIKPDLKYTHQSSDINYGTKTYTMSFDITDKYYTSGELALTDLDVIMKNGQKDESGNEIKYDLRALAEAGTISLSYNVQPLTATNVNITNESTGNVETIASHPIGHKYTLTISNLEQLEIKTGLTTADYSGVITVAITKEKIVDRSNNKNVAKTITSGVDIPAVSGEGTTSSGTYLPLGFTEVSPATSTEGLTIQDAVGNQYVWVEVPKTSTVYPTAGISLNLESLTGTALTNAYTAIENDLNTYTTAYKDRSSYKDTYSGNDEASGLTSTQYTELKQNMLKSVYQNGGFYVGKYETGSTVARSSSGDELTTPVIQANAYPYNFVTNSQAQSLASRLSSGGYTSSLMFGIQWDLVLKYLETKGVEQSLLNSDSITIGNYYTNSWNITNENAKYWTTSTGWQTGLSGTKPAISTLLSTGADSSFSKMGIYDIAGNVYEWTLEYSSNSDNPCVARGGSYGNLGDDPAHYRSNDTVSENYNNYGFRVALYKTSNATPVVVDVVDPIWEKIESSALAKTPDQGVSTSATTGTATIKVRGTDTYLNTANTDDSTLTSDEIEVYINGTKNTSITPVVELVEPVLTENRVVDGTTTTVQYGVEYTIAINGWVQNANQVKIKILEDAIKDKSGNGNKEKELIVYNVLRKTNTENQSTGQFLGNSNIQRKDVNQIIFASSLKNAPEITDASMKSAPTVDGNICWDVSAQGDNSILAWRTTTAPYTVYIGSDAEIFGNQDSSYLFRTIGYGSNVTAEQTIVNLDLLNTSSVINMEQMFAYCGYTAMTSLNLGVFDTKNVTNMNKMFGNCGYTAMTSLNLGTAFDTTNVENMQGMFNNCGYTKMQTLSLGSLFDTGKVTNMRLMFASCGYFEMTSLNLGSEFDTSNVENMQRMFQNCGYEKMTTLSLGTKFDTSKVEDMSYMFLNCGYKKLGSLDLSAGTASTNTTQFNTSAVTDMQGMFFYLGYESMTQLNLGNNFDTTNVTNMKYMFNRCGYGKMTSLNLKNKFNTAKVTDMYGMFTECGYTEMTSLELGNQFYTTLVKDMYKMFNGCGKTKMTVLDLGPVFTQTPNQDIAETTEVTYDEFDNPTSQVIPAHNSCQYFITDAGTTSCIIYAPEAIYSNRTTFKLSSIDTTNTIAYAQGTINPIYRPEWEKVQSTIDVANKKINIELKGTASKTQTIDANVSINYSSNVESTLTTNDISVYIDGELDGDTNRNGQIDAGETPKITKALSNVGAMTDVAQATHVLTLSTIDSAGRINGRPFQEWSGNISLKIKNKTLIDKYGSYVKNETDGEGNPIQVPVVGVSKDLSSNKIGNTNLESLDDATGTWIDVKYEGTGTETANNTSSTETMFSDFIKPEFTYVSSTTEIEHGAEPANEKVTVIFDVADKYFNTSQLTTNTNPEDLITLKFDENDEVNSNVNKALDTTAILVMNKSTGEITAQPTTYIIQEGERKVGERYTLVVTGLDKEDGFTYSGYMTLTFGSGIVTDYSNNGNNPMTLTIGKDEPGGSEGDEEIVDVVDPIWVLGTINRATGEVEFTVKDKYLDATTSQFNLEAEDILVYVNGNRDGDLNRNGIIEEGITEDANGNGVLDEGEDLNGNGMLDTDLDETPSIGKTLTGPIEITANQEYKYTLKLTNITPEGGDYTEFPPLDEIVGGNAEYKDENGGSIAIKIAANTITDQYENTSNETPFTIGVFDETQPEIYQVQETADPVTNTETIIFNVTDKNYYNPELPLDAQEEITKDEITIYVDGVQVDRLIQDAATTLSKVNIRAILNGTPTLVGHQYTLVIADLAETARQLGKDYLEYSGTVEIRIDEDAVQDIKGNTLNTETTTIKDFVDYIEPEIRYTHQNSHVNYTAEDTNNNGTLDAGEDTNGNGILDEAKSYSMTFEVVDKYYNSAEFLTLDDLTILMQNGQYQKDASGNYVLDANNNKIPIVYDLKEEDVTINLHKKAITVPSIIKTTDVVEETYETLTNAIIGYEYTLQITNLEKYFIGDNLTTADFSGVITVAIAADAVHDEGPTTGVDEALGNNAKTLTSGISFEDGEESGNKLPIDVVDPLVTKVSSSANAIDPADTDSSIAYVTFDVTDSYFAESKLTSSNIANYIKVVVNGTETAIVPTIEETTNLTETRLVNGVETEDVQYGVRYKLKITGFAQNANQVKIRVLTGMVLDQDPGTSVQNTNKTTDLIVYNMLKCATVDNVDANGVADGDEGFLGNTSIQRQNIENITFLANTKSAPGTGTWDVSAQGDNSIIAWYETSNANGALKVYIASDDEIFANQNSQYLFSYIGSADICTATSAVTNLNLLNTTGVTNMLGMFRYFGYNSMSTLDLGNNFDTSNVTSMHGMFYYTGYKAMTSLDLKDKFDTSNVTSMNFMFSYCGYTALIGLDLEDKFDTSSVTSMENMFKDCGYTALTSLDLGEKFDTSRVTNMEDMFSYCGYTALTSLDLGEKFDTSKVTNMKRMFFTMRALTTLDLGDKFDTRNVTNMEHMFGYLSNLTILDLGDKFYTTSVENANRMFRLSGKLKVLDLGPNFTRIPDGTITFDGEEIDAYTKMFAVGSQTNCTIYAPSSIYNDMKHFKLDADSTTTIEYTNGTINPIYKPEWEKVSSTINVDATNVEDSTISVTIKGYANETFTNGSYTGTYTSDVQSYLPVGTTLTDEQARLINVWIDGELDGDFNKNGILDEDETPLLTRKVEEVSITASEVQYKITLSNFKEATRQTGKNFKEWSGNITIQPVDGTLIDKYGSYLTTQTVTDDDGNEVEVQVPVVNVFTDASGNKLGNANMDEIDLTEGTWTRIELKDETTTDTNTNGSMFTDYIKPEFTYKYSSTDINYENKTVTVVFDVTDKYFNTSTITAENITVAMLDDASSDVNTKVSKDLSIKTIPSNQTDGNITYTTDGSIYYNFNGTSRKIGTRYQLVIGDLEQDPNKAYIYSGPMSISFPSGLASDKSGNVNNATTISIGRDETGNSTADNYSSTNPYLPDGYRFVDGTSLATGLVIEDTLGNQFVWVEVPKTTTVYPTAGLNIKSFTNEEYDKIEEDLRNYTSDYGTEGFVDEFSGNDSDIGLTESEYYNLKKTMLKSVYKNGGFYVGRYETGIMDSFRTANGETTQTPVIQANAYPYTYVTGTQAQSLSSSMASNGYTSSLMFGVQWDLVLKYLQMKNVATEAQLNEDSTGWGNYKTSLWTITNENSKYWRISSPSEWTESAYGNKPMADSVLLTTGASDTFSKQNIYDIAGNIREWTLEYNYNATGGMVVPYTFRGGRFTSESNNYSSYRDNSLPINYTVGFRTALYKNEDVEVDVVDPIWTGPNDVNEIIRNRDDAANTDKVEITILGSDKYYKTNTLSVGEDKNSNGTLDEGEDINGNGQIDGNNITVYVDNVAVSTITKTLEAITDTTTLQTLATGAGLEGAAVGYKLTLGNFGTNNGEVKIVINGETIKDESGNGNVATTIYVGNVEWEEANETLEDTDPNYPRYDAFRENIVDFIKPIITYTHSTVEGAENPDVDYEEKTVTVKFTVSDKYLIGSDLIGDAYTVQEGGVDVQKYAAKNIDIIIDGTDRTSQVTTSITADSTDLTDGEVVYTLTVSNIEQDPNNGFDFSGVMQLVFAQGVIDDRSGNFNDTKTITLDTEVGSDILDVVDPIIMFAEGTNLSYRNTVNSINRTDDVDTVTVRIRATDKYLSGGTMQLTENVAKIKVKVQKPDGTVVEDASATSIDESLRVTKAVAYRTQVGGATPYIEYDVTLGNFGENEGIVSIIIPEDVVTDTSGNGNIETEVLVGNAEWSEAAGTRFTAFNNSIVDFTDPTWHYATSSITRDRAGQTGTVTVKILGFDIYNFERTLTKEVIKTYVNNVENTTIVKDLVEITDADELTTLVAQAGLTDKVGTRTVTDVITGYTLTLSNFQDYDRVVKIEIPANTIRDTSGNGNIVTTMLVGNPQWVETDVTELDPSDANYPKYKGFRNSTVDFIKPIIVDKYSLDTDRDGTAETVFTDNAIIDRTVGSENVQIYLNMLDTNILENNVEIGDIQIFVDSGAYEMDVTGTIGKVLNKVSDITDAEDRKIGERYKLTLSGFELANLINSEIFKRHSGIIKLVIAQDQVEDTSGNKNNTTTITVNQFQESDGTIIGIADFVKPIIYYDSHFLDWNDRYAEITLKGTDRFLDETSNLDPETIKLYELTDAGEYIEVTDFDGKKEVTRVALEDANGNLLGYNYIIKLNDFEEEFKMKVVIPAGYVDTEDGSVVGLGDTSGNLNEQTEIEIVLDNKKPRWHYVSSNSANFDNNGSISFTVKGEDKFLDISTEDGTARVSSLDEGDLRIIRDGEDITSEAGITVEEISRDTAEKSITYKIDVTGLTEVGTYSLVFADENADHTPILVDEFDNRSAKTTITFSKSAMYYDASNPNTNNYAVVTYHVSPDNETVHKSFVHELMEVNSTGTNFESTYYYPSSVGEIYNNGENPLFAEPEGYSFKHWAVADEKGVVSAGATTYGLYDPIPNTVRNLKAVWQQATVIYVSNTTGDNSDNGTSATTPVKDLQTAYSKLDTSKGADANIIVIMDAVEVTNSTGTLTGNATITSLYAGVDYRKQGAELKVSSNMIVDGSIIFDNIKLYSDSTTVSGGTDYLANGTYTNMLISNYSGEITLGRGITTPEGKYTFGAIIGGNYKTETSTGELGEHTIRVEAGKYNNIIAGSTLTSSTETAKYVQHNMIIGNIRDAAISVNDKLTITGYVAMGENEQSYIYPYGSSGSSDGYEEDYSNITLYSGTFTGTNKFAKESEGIAIYARSIDGNTDGIATFTIYGGIVNGNIYAGSRAQTGNETEIVNEMYFYGGQVTGNIFGQGSNNSFAGSSKIEVQGNFSITGNIFGGSNVTTEGQGNGTGDTNITINSSSAIVNGNIYGGSNGRSNSGYITGSTNITLKAGTVKNIYGSGKNAGNSVETNITIENGTVVEDVIGGAYQAQGGTTDITVTGGTIGGDIIGGNENTAEAQLTSDTTAQDITITIGDTAEATSPTINGTIYGSGRYDKVGTTNIYLNKCANTLSVYGGSDTNSQTTRANIYLQGMTVNEIYGGGNAAGTVTTSNIYLKSGTVTEVYGGGYQADVGTANIYVGETNTDTASITSVYGGSNISGTVTTSNITLTSATSIVDIFGGGNSTAVGTANVTLNGMTVDTIHGGSKNAGVTTSSNITLTSGTVTNVFGGGIDVGVTTTNINHTNGATVTNIYGGNNTADVETGVGGDTGTANINIKNSTVENVYGGNNSRGTTTNTNITIQGTSVVTGKLYGGGYKSDIGKSGSTGSTIINIAGGTITNDINGGSEQGKVYGTTTINIGKDATGNNSLTAGNITIGGNIYGAGSSENSNYSYVSVEGYTSIVMDNNTSSPITFSGSIFGAGKYATYSQQGTETDGGTIKINDLGTETTAHQITSIERTGEVIIGNSYIELLGRQDANNALPKVSYTANRITKALTVYDGTTIYTRRGFNMVGGFNSYNSMTAYGTGIKATATMNADGTVTVSEGSNNRLYTLEGVNLIFAKKETDLYTNPVKADFSDVNGMTFFGMYKLNRTTNAKEYDIYDPNYSGGATTESVFRVGTFVEAKHKDYHNTQTDGFYTNVATYGEGTVTTKYEYIGTTDYTAYYDWIIGAETVNYNVTVIGSATGKNSVAELLLDHGYQAGMSYTLNEVSLNALDTNVELINSLDVPVIAPEDADDTFALRIQTDTSGWLNNGKTNIYTADGGKFDGTETYNSDLANTPASIKFKLYSSIDITQTKDLGNVNLVYTAKTNPLDPSQAITFKIVIAVNIQTELEEITVEDLEYVPTFTHSSEDILSYTADSTVDLTYTMYKTNIAYPYLEDDYRVLSSTIPFPAGTRITIKDYLQGYNRGEAYYYYHIPSNTAYDDTEEVDGEIRYLYNLSNFRRMGSTNDYYEDDNNSYYHDTYVLEKYEVSIDFGDANIDANKLAQETYMNLRYSGGALKYDNGIREIAYNLYTNKNAIVSETISNENVEYSIVEDIEIPFTLDASISLQDEILDTKYNEKITGMGIKLVNEHGATIKIPELQNFKIIDLDTSNVYTADLTGMIRVPLMEGLSSVTHNYKLIFTQVSVESGKYAVEVHLFTADDGIYYSQQTTTFKEFFVTFINRLEGLAGIEATGDSRIIDGTTGKNLEGNNGLDMTISVALPTNHTNVRAELYKRNTTYTDLSDETTYTGTSYELIDLSQYLEGTWVTPESQGLISPTGSMEYIIHPRQTYESAIEMELIEFEKAIKEGIDTGEYKLVIKVYHDNTLIQTEKKTFIVTE